MICKHQFIAMPETAHMPDPASPVRPGDIGSVYRELYGAKAGCALCGQIRHIWPNGTVEIVETGKILDEDGHDIHA